MRHGTLVLRTVCVCVRVRVCMSVYYIVEDAHTLICLFMLQIRTTCSADACSKVAKIDLPRTHTQTNTHESGNKSAQLSKM